jgi:hypothetical protein
MKLGCLPSPGDHRRLKLASYLDVAKLPAAPASVHYSPAVLAHGGYGMLYNDALGCCVVSMMYHTLMQMSYNDGRVLPIPTQQEFISVYSDIGGYVSGDPSTDNGCNMADAMKYSVSQ